MMKFLFLPRRMRIRARDIIRRELGIPAHHKPGFPQVLVLVAPLPPRVGGVWRQANRSISLNSKQSFREAVASLAHEVGHCEEFYLTGRNGNSHGVYDYFEDASEFIARICERDAQLLELAEEFLYRVW